MPRYLKQNNNLPININQSLVFFPKSIISAFQRYDYVTCQKVALKKRSPLKSEGAGKFVVSFFIVCNVCSMANRVHVNFISHFTV